MKVLLAFAGGVLVGALSAISEDFLIAAMVIATWAIIFWARAWIYDRAGEGQQSTQAVNAMKRYAHDSQVLQGDVEGPSRLPEKLRR